MAAIGLLAGVAPGCADVWGLEELELEAPQQDATTEGGAAGDASVEADGAAADGPSDTLWDAQEAAGDVSAEGSLDAADAKETLQPEADADAAAQPDSGCPPGTKLCQDTCVLTDNPTTGCAAASCEPCPLEHASAMCDSNLKCAIAKCEYGYDDCNGVGADGCEAALKTDPNNCSTCGVKCAYAQAQGKCLGGACSMGWCDAGWTDCDGTTANGCEVNTATDVTDCGGCGNVCSFAHATATCLDGSCGLGACNGQYADCDGEPSNGCEVNLQSDPMNCGTCAKQCDPDGGTMVCTNAQCVVSTCPVGLGECDGNPATLCETDLSTTMSHCGACGNACQLANATPVCALGSCEIATCVAPYLNCDGNKSNGCETNAKTSLLHCGQCGTVCPGGPNAAPSCVNGVCGTTCDTGFGDCDGDPSNGCEADLLKLPAHCGGCNLACPTYPNAVALCTAGTCSSACAAGFGDCDALSTNGCETNLFNSATNCGLCGKQCNSNHGTPSCMQGVCAIACESGWGNCDGAASNGCETSITTTSDCGACGSGCANPNGTTACTGGACVPTCASGYGNCDGNPSNGCETALTTATNCGGCGVPCAFPNASATCGSGTCTFGACAAGWGNCDGNTANGCETDTSTTASHCGACGTVCAGAHGSAVCTGGACSIVCDGGWGNCDGLASNGCETSLVSNVSHCGACANACSFAHAAAECFGGTCQPGACEAGWGNCDGASANGCEAELKSLASCGACGMPCSLANATESCSTGTCAIVSCDAGFGNCDGNAANGCETATSTSTNHCGACGTVCNSTNGTPSCAAGLCSIACSAGFGNCDGSVANGCEASLSTTANCGVCGKACTNANGTTQCVSAACIPSCSAGFSSCDGDASNGCEANTQQDPGNCGACGTLCLNAHGTTSCIAGTCAPACDAGFGNCDGNAVNGCETSLATTSNCGACLVGCTNANGTTACVSGGCVPVCAVGFGDCDGNPGNGCETNQAANVNHCGACGNACICVNGTASCTAGVCGCTPCATGTGNCDGNSANGCETALTSLTNCGGCGVPCDRAHATATCATGTCEIAACNTGWANCDGNAANGCETNTQTSLSNCGVCGTVCGGANGVPSCTLGACSLVCNAGYGNCDGLYANGCEAALATTQNCGACGTVCSNAHGTTVCNSGVCVPTCEAGWASCDGNPVNGCETSLQTSVDNCGACGTSCGNPHGTTSCVAGVCAPVCTAGWGDCDGNLNNGCGTNLLTTATDCGACGNACTNAHGTTSCVAGVCTPVCSAGWANCDGNAANGCETNTQTSLSHCGACGAVCGGTNATPTCSLGVCTITCATGYGNCNLSVADGCETALTTTSNCGACGVVCTNGHGTTSCSSGACAPVCSTGWGNCDANAPNGCETPLNTLTNCGGCGTVCARANATPTCSTGTCQISSCNAGWGNCDGNSSNGCETQLNTVSNCGACGTTCTRANATSTCSTGACAILSCNAGWGNCDGNNANGCETALNTVTNCGACGSTCTNAHGTTQCISGACSPTCSSGWGNCDGNNANGCESALTTLTNCGNCGVACSRPNATATCSTGSCQISSCNTGYLNCDGNNTNGCETNGLTDVSNCGVCARACGTQNVMSRSCTSGKCSSTCYLGYANCNLPATGTDDGCEKSVSADAYNCGWCGNSCDAMGGGLQCGGSSRPASQCGCATNYDCNWGSGATGWCDTATGLCHCNGYTCGSGHICRAPNQGTACSCNGGTYCPSGQTCCQTPAGCKNLQTDPANCLACGRACPPGFNCTSNGCVCSGNPSCNAGSPGTCNSSGFCVCGTTTCARGKRCQVGGGCS